MLGVTEGHWKWHHWIDCIAQAQAPLLTRQNRIEIKLKNKKMIYAKRLSE